LESVCWGNSTVGSNPTLSAISLVPQKYFYTYFFLVTAEACTGLQRKTKWPFKLFSTGERSSHLRIVLCSALIHGRTFGSAKKQGASFGWRAALV
jgi:hypothetical protein